LNEFKITKNRNVIYTKNKMDKEKADQLKKRRLLLNEEIRLKTLRQRISTQLNYLDEQSCDYKIFYEHENLNWISTNVALRKKDRYSGSHDYQIEVNDASENCFSISCNSETSLKNGFKELLLTIVLKNSRLIVIYNGGDPEIEISVKSLLLNPLLFFSSPETWLITKDKQWVIEYIWDQEMIKFIHLRNMKPVLVKRIIFQKSKVYPIV
jgi:hypothetical protein